MLLAASSLSTADNWFFAQNRVMFCAMDQRAGWIREKAATSLNPSQVETTLVQLNEQWPGKRDVPCRSGPTISVR